MDGGETLGDLASRVLEVFGLVNIIGPWCSGLSGLGPGWIPQGGPADAARVGSGLRDEKERSAETCRAQKHCHLLTRPGTQRRTLPCCWSPFGNGPGPGHRLTSPQLVAGQDRGGMALPRHGYGRARWLAATSNHGRSGGGRAPTTVLQVLSPLTSQEMTEVALLVPKELMNLYPAAKSDFKVSGQHPAAWCRETGQVLVITASDARAAKDLGKRALGCKKKF